MPLFISVLIVGPVEYTFSGGICKNPHFGITAGGIGYQLKILGLKRKRRWPEEEDNFLKDNYLKMTNRELARELGKTICAIDKRLGTLNLRRLEKWTPEREQFLWDNYSVMELRAILRSRFFYIMDSFAEEPERRVI